jgi:hypothetical protein
MFVGFFTISILFKILCFKDNSYLKMPNGLTTRINPSSINPSSINPLRKIAYSDSEDDALNNALNDADKFSEDCRSVNTDGTYDDLESYSSDASDASGEGSYDDVPDANNSEASDNE